MTPDDVKIGDVWRDLDKRELSKGRTVMVTSLGPDFARVVADPSGRHTRIHRSRLVRKFELISRLPYPKDAA